MLTHDPITIPHELLKGRGSKGLETTTLLVQQRVCFAEHEANTGSIRLSLMEFAPYVCSPCSVERYIIRMSESGKIISADDSARAKILTHPVVEQTKNRERTRSSHKGTSILSNFHSAIHYLIMFSAIHLFFWAQHAEFIGHEMCFRANSERFSESVTQKCGKSCTLYAVNHGLYSIVSEPISCSSQICGNEDMTRTQTATQSSKDTIFRMRSIRKDLRYPRQQGGPKNLSYKVTFGKQMPEFSEYTLT
jgi:hypothetical protein